MELPPLSYLSPKTTVRDSPIHGRGLFATGEFRPGEIVCVKGGHIFTRTMLDKVAPLLGPAEIQIADDLFIGPIDPEQREGGMIFSNHSCDPNIGVQAQIVFVALRRIFPSEVTIRRTLRPVILYDSLISSPRKEEASINVIENFTSTHAVGASRRTRR